MAIGLAFEAAAAERVRAGRIEIDADAVRADEPRPDHERARLTKRQAGTILSDQTAAAWREHARAVKAAHVARDKGAGVARKVRVDRGFQYAGDYGALRDRCVGALQRARVRCAGAATETRGEALVGGE